MLRTFIILFLILVFFDLRAQPNQLYCKNLYKVKLQDANGSSTRIEKIMTSMDLAVIIFFNDECPICRYYVPKLKELDSICNANQVPLMCIFSGTYDVSSIQEFGRSYDISTKLYLDPQNRVAKCLAAKVTPQVFLVNTKQSSIIYSGMIDDSFVSLGVRRTISTQNYFIDAFDNFLKGNDVLIIQTKAVGCTLNY